MVLEHKRSNAGNSDMPKSICKVLHFSEKVQVFDVIWKEKKLYAEVAKIFGKKEPSIHKIVKREEEIHASFSFASQTAKVTAIVCGKCLSKMKKALNFTIKYFEGVRKTTNIQVSLKYIVINLLFYY